MSIETETGSTPDLSRVRLTFLCATMKGASEVAIGAGKAARRTRRRDPDLGFATARVPWLLGRPQQRAWSSCFLFSVTTAVREKVEESLRLDTSVLEEPRRLPTANSTIS
ncbi:hypothetical protein BHE74_00019166 [Ensete ventricosum]|nr:hypothetical protein GW17_00031777 [Ensete ventricosum]RWW72991.1 hypothetical protein BHE74_00019166 [Ensete ventricosum]